MHRTRYLVKMHKTSDMRPMLFQTDAAHPYGGTQQMVSILTPYRDVGRLARRMDTSTAYALIIVMATESTIDPHGPSKGVPDPL